MTISIRCDHRGCARSIDAIWHRLPPGWVCSSPAAPLRHRCPEHADAWSPAPVPREVIDERLRLVAAYIAEHPGSTDAQLAAHLAEHGHHVHRRTAQRFRIAADPTQQPRMKRANRRDNHGDRP